MLALIVIDIAVVIAWFAFRRRTASPRGDSTPTVRPIDAETDAEVCRLVKSRKTTQAIALLRERSGMSLREAKDAVDAGCAADRSALLRIDRDAHHQGAGNAH